MKKIDRRTIQRRVLDNDLYSSTPYKRYFNLQNYMIITKLLEKFIFFTPFQKLTGIDRRTVQRRVSS